MKTVLFIFATFFMLGHVFANPLCAAQEKYKQRIDLGNGKVLFVEPGLYTSGKNYRLLCVDSGANPNYRCTPEVHEACKYLGMNKASSWEIDSQIDKGSYIYFKEGGKIYFANSTRESYVSELVCE